jgi:hypothetical protein
LLADGRVEIVEGQHGLYLRPRVKAVEEAHVRARHGTPRTWHGRSGDPRGYSHNREVCGAWSKKAAAAFCPWPRVIASSEMIEKPKSG